ncbi:hypothetical protein [Halorussus litoreus]|uniref:hypothetical protein n=1 Tax=Halorussus litoreus TaxID=1710536 RepID=UPI000E24A1FF|nr:hypothetical protein [Halorussus litoreus]
MGGDEHTHRTSAVHDEPVGTMGRRRFVDTLLGLGFGALSASLLTAEDVAAAGRDEVPVVYGLTRDGDGSNGDSEGGGGSNGDGGGLVPRRRTVPADWYDDLRSALAAHRNLEAVHRDGVASSAVAPGEYGGRNAVIHVEVTAERARGEVPERVGDTPVEVRKVERVEDRGGSDGGVDPGGDDPESPVSPDGGVPGSVAVGTKKVYGTLAPAMTDPSDGARYFATANHVFGGSDNGGTPVYLLDGERTKIGSIRAAYPKSDLAAARPESSFRPLHRIHDSDPGEVLGQFTRAGLADLKARGESLTKIGAKTGRSSGTIQAVDGLTCAYGAICKRGQLKWGEESGFADGDSGSVNFHPDPENPDEGVLVGGFNNARTWWPGENYVWGTAAYHVTEKHGLTF